MILSHLPRLKPDTIRHSVLDIDADYLRTRGIAYLLFDVDDTLVERNGSKVDKAIVTHIKQLTNGPIKQIFIASNSRRDLSSIAKQINARVITSSLLSRKPLGRHYRKILKEINKPATSIAMVGDRLLTDVLGGNLAGMTTILVHPLKGLRHDAVQVITAEQPAAKKLSKNFAHDFLTWSKRFVNRESTTGLNRTLWFLAGTLALIAFGILVDAVNDQDVILRLDSAVSSFFIEHRTALLTNILLTITATAGTVATILLTTLWAILLRGKRYRRAAYALVMAAMFQAIIVLGIKLLFARERPDELLRLMDESSFSFPSGHTMVATMVWGSAVYLLARSLKTHWQKRLVVFGYVLGVLTIAMSRVYLGVHFLSDTLASIALGTGIMALYLAFTADKTRQLPDTVFTPGLRRRLLSGFIVMFVTVLLWRGAFL